MSKILLFRLLYDPRNISIRQREENISRCIKTKEELFLLYYQHE